MFPCASRSGCPLSSVCGTPALRKYLLTMMSVASWLHCFGISASFISKTTEPSGLEMRLVRFSYSTEANGSEPAAVKRRLIFMIANPFTRKRLTRRNPLRRHGRRHIARRADAAADDVGRLRVGENPVLMTGDERARDGIGETDRHAVAI